MNLPNLITILRILLIPVFIYYFASENYLLSGIIFTVSGITDFLDGFLARRYNLITEIGKLLDPFADKLTIISILSVLVYTNIIPRVITVTLLAREIFILLGSAVTYFMGINLINPSRLGKLSTFLLYLAIAFKLFPIGHIDMLLFYIVIPLNIVSGINYIKHALTTIKFPEKR